MSGKILLSVLEHLESEKGINRADMIDAIISSIKTAATKGVYAGLDLKITISPNNGDISAWAILEVVDSVSDPRTQIHLEKARLYNPDAKIGDKIEKPIDPSELGRIAAQSARQAIMQRIRKFEKEGIFDSFKEQIGDIVTGVVRRRERGALVVELGKAEAIMPPEERVPGEDFQPGDRVRFLLLDIEHTSRGPEIILSRASKQFVKRLLELEVTEIQDGSVIVESIVRDPGYRSKVCVRSNDPKIDPVGACVGARGSRVRNIVKELGGEKIDIIQFFDDPVKLLEESFRPAALYDIKVDEKGRRLFFKVAESDLPVALGKRGQNARLTSQLLGWKLVFEKDEVKQADPTKRWTSMLMQQIGVSKEQAEKLVAAGIVSLEAFNGVAAEDLQEIGFTAEEAQQLLSKVQ